MPRNRLRSATTRARENRARNNRDAAIEALQAGHVLRVSNRTDIKTGTVHQALARNLVRMMYAEYPPDETREGWRDMTRIKRGVR